MSATIKAVHNTCTFDIHPIHLGERLLDTYFLLLCKQVVTWGYPSLHLPFSSVHC